MYRNTRMETMNNAVIELDFFEVINCFEEQCEAQNT